jgi:hypothetical protein
LKDIFASCNFIFVPGNHDVDLSSIGELKSDIETTLIYKGKDSFRDYKNHKQDKLRNFHSFLKLNGKVFNSKPKNESSCLIRGFDKKITYFCVNSATFSAPDFYVAEIHKDAMETNFNSSFLNTSILDSLEVNQRAEILYALNGQGMQAYDFDPILEQIEMIYDNPKIDYFNIFVTHHPLEWITSDQKYSWNIEKGEDQFYDLPLNKLMKISPIMLVGHEHLTYVEQPIYLGETAVLKGQKFLDHHLGYFDKCFNKDLDCGFSILEVDTETNEAFRRIYICSHDKNEGFKWSLKSNVAIHINKGMEQLRILSKIPQSVKILELDQKVEQFIQLNAALYSQFSDLKFQMKFVVIDSETTLSFVSKYINITSDEFILNVDGWFLLDDIFIIDLARFDLEKFNFQVLVDLNTIRIFCFIFYELDSLTKAFKRTNLASIQKGLSSFLESELFQLKKKYYKILEKTEDIIDIYICKELIIRDISDLM